jgi:hypothetical protein
MKTLEDKAQEYAVISGALDAGYSTETEEAYRQGAREAQHWFPVTEELPEETGWMNAPYLAKTKNEIHVVGFTKGYWHHYGGLCLREDVVMYWRPIERR